MPDTIGSGVIGIPVKMYTPNWKVEINSTDVSTYIINADVVPSVSNAVWIATVVLDNYNGRYTNTFSKGQIIKVYGDFKNGTTQIFEGRINTFINDISENGMTLEIRARGYGEEALEIHVFEQYTTATTISQVFKDLITNYLPNHSTDFTYIATLTTTVTPNWDGKSVWNCFQDLILWAKDEGNYDFYCDFNKKWHLFKRGSSINTAEAIIYGDNLINIRNEDTLDGFKNRVVVYGKEIETIPNVSARENKTLQSTYWLKERLETDSNLITNTEVYLKASSLLSTDSTIEDKGNCTSIGLPTLVPGQNIYIASPFSNIMGYRTAIEVRHTFSSDGFFTGITYQEKEKGLIKFLSDRKQFEQQSQNTNTFGMKHTYAGTFLDENYGVDGSTPDSDAFLEDMDNDKTVVWEDALMLNLTETLGKATTKETITSANVKEVVFKVSGSNFESDYGESWLTCEVSVDGGLSWEEVEKDTKYTVQGLGKKLKLRVTMISLTTKIRAFGVLYNTVDD